MTKPSVCPVCEQAYGRRIKAFAYPPNMSVFKGKFHYEKKRDENERPYYDVYDH